MEIKIPGTLKTPVNTHAYSDSPPVVQYARSLDLAEPSPGAPWGRRKDGTPRLKPGAKDRTAHVRELARPLTEEALETLVSVMRDKDAPPAARVGAANSVLDRAWGKPKETLEIDNPSEGLRTVLAGVSSSDLVELMRVLKAGAVEAPRDVTPLPDVLALPEKG